MFNGQAGQKNGGETLKKMSGEFVKSKIKHWPGKRRAGWIRYPVPKGPDWEWYGDSM